MPSSTDVVFGAAQIGQTVSSELSISNPGTETVQVTQLNVSGTAFAVTGQTPSSFAVAPGATVTLSLGFDPSAVGDADGDLSVMGGSSSGPPLAQIHLHGTGAAILKAVSCANASMTGAGTDACSVTFNYPAPKKLTVSLTSSLSAVSVPESVVVSAGTTSASFNAAIAAVTAAQNATISASTSSQTVTTSPIELGAATPSLAVSSSSVDFGSVVEGQSGTQTVTLSSVGTLPVTVSSLSISSSLFSASGVSVPFTLNPGQTASVNLVFTASSAGSYTAALAVGSNSASGNLAVNLEATSVVAPALKGLTCGSASMTGAGTDACSLTLTLAAPSGGLTIRLSSSDAAVTVPLSVTIPAGSAGANFTANAAAVTAAQTATLSASAAGSTTQTFSIQLNPAIPTLTVSSTTLSFGNVNVGQTATQSITLSSTGTAPVTVSAISITGSAFTESRFSAPMTLNPGQTTTVTVSFVSAQASVYTGTLTITSNSSQGKVQTNISATAVAVAKVSAVSCTSASISGAGSDACTVTLTSAAAAGGLNVTLASSNAAVTIPASVTVGANATSAVFTATCTAVTSNQTATLTASGGGLSSTFLLQLQPPAQKTLSVNATSISFGNVVVSDTGTQSLTLSSTGAAAVTVSSATTTGTGFSVSGLTFPLTLNAGQTATLNVQFKPTATGAATGQLTIASNSSTGATAAVRLTGTGQPHEVQLAWHAPSGSSDPISGYRIYRASVGSASYTLLNSGLDSQVSYTDTGVQTGASYQYYVTTVDSSGKESVPSNTATVTIP